MQTFKQCQGCLERSQDVQERFFLISLDEYCNDCFSVKEGKLYASLTTYDNDRIEEIENDPYIYLLSFQDKRALEWASNRFSWSVFVNKNIDADGVLYLSSEDERRELMQILDDEGLPCLCPSTSLYSFLTSFYNEG